MPAKSGQKLIGSYVDEAQARVTDGGTSAALRRLVAEAVSGKALAPRGVGWGAQVGERFKPVERLALALGEAAKAHGTSPAN
jgi:hypothetical protein